MRRRQEPGIRFKETMSGWVTRGESDYRLGETKGRAAGESLAIHAIVTIPDIHAFIIDPEHEAQLSATIDYSPFGNGIRSTMGSVKLFVPSDDSCCKFMKYEMGFRYNDRDYYLTGKKRVNNDPGFDMWSDTTTLYTSLHQGADNKGTLFAAGVLSLGMTELIRIVASMDVLGHDRLKEKAEIVSRFGAFFMGELWDSFISETELSPDTQ